MKSFIGSACVILAASTASAQPGAPTPVPPPTPLPAPQTPGQPPVEQTPDQPSWLPGVQDVTAEEMATPGKVTLTMARAVELAAKQHPTVRIARAAADAAVGRVEAARVPLHPTVTVAGSISAGSSSSIPHPCNGTDPTNICTGGFFDPTAGTGLSAKASWTITDFGLTRANVRSAEASADAAVAGTASSTLDVRLGVENAYLESLARHRLTVVADATVKSEEGHLDQAKRFVAAQAHDPIEVAQAESRLANARSALAQAQSNEAVALADLRAAIGWLDPTRAPAVDPRWPNPVDTEPPQLGSLVDTARKHRPEIVQLDKLIFAADESLTAAHAERRPTLAATATTGWSPTIYNVATDPQPTWTAGLTLSWLHWDGGKSAADVHVARAKLQSAIASRDALLVSLTSALESARAQIIANNANVKASSEAVIAAQVQLKLSDARYAQGLGSQIELADAQTAVTTASGNLIQAEWQLADAWAALQRALADI